jgi:hypothetical protein
MALTGIIKQFLKIMDELDPEIKDNELEEEEEMDDDVLVPGKKKSKNPDVVEDDSLDALADAEEDTLPEDSYDDEDLW